MRLVHRILILLACALLMPAKDISVETGGELRFTIRLEPKSFHPLQADNESSEIIRYLTSGSLMRLNRLTQELQSELAETWKVSEGNRRLDFTLRSGIQFSDGTPFTCEDVGFTARLLLDRTLISPTAESFRTGPGQAETKCATPLSGMVRFPAPVAALAAQFDQVPILSAHSPKKEAAGLGPFALAEYRAGYSVLLHRNPYYWKRDSDGRKLPYLDSIRLDIQQNRDTEVLRFRRGQSDLINKLDPELFDQLANEMPSSVIDAGPSLDWELVFFNQVANAPIEAYKKTWFRSSAFRRAVSEAINRDDLCRIVYRGHATPANGPVSPSNKFWVNPGVRAQPYSAQAALQRLSQEGFRMSGAELRDKDGHRVEFSMITNSGNKLHARMMTMIQQDLAKIGIHLNLVTLDFPSLAERISRTFQYESCLLAFTGLQTDPSSQMTIWPSSAENHQWNPSQKQPETPWEAEIDKLMLAQNAGTSDSARRVSFLKLQQIVAEQSPFLFLVYPNALSAISPRLKNVQAALLQPQLVWDIEHLYLARK